jgi:tripartite-type tricarboxylate transporter receptor subunit TctC
MVVHPALPVKSLADLVSYAKAKPGTVNYAASAPGGGQHLAWELIKRTTATDIVYVPYKGTGALMPDLLAGRLQAGIDNVAVLTPYIKSGALRPLAVTGAKRSALLPDVPTLAESGFPNLLVIGWFGVFAPAKTPAPIVKQLNDALVEVMKQKDMRDRITELGGDAESGSQEELRKLLASEMALWGKVIKDAGIKLD